MYIDPRKAASCRAAQAIKGRCDACDLVDEFFSSAIGTVGNGKTGAATVQSGTFCATISKLDPSATCVRGEQCGIPTLLAAAHPPNRKFGVRAKVFLLQTTI